MDDLKKGNLKISGPKRVLRGIYSSGGSYSLVSAYALRYPQAIFTLSSALSLYAMGDYLVEPPFSLAFPRGSRICHDPAIEQHFVSAPFFSLGETSLVYEGRRLRVYDQERLLVEVFHAKNKLGPERYKSAIASYRKIVRTSQFSVPKFESYCRKLAFAKSYMNRLSLEAM